MDELDVAYLAATLDASKAPGWRHPAAPEGEVRLTEAEREAWDVDPDLWPHTPPLHIFRALMDEDDNVWWRASGGHGLNAYDAAIEQIDELAERVRVVEGERDAARAALEPFRTANLVVRKCENGRHGPSASDFDASADCQRCRAESAEAALAELRAGVEALADDFESEIDWSNGRSNYGDNAAWESAARQLRALLGGAS